MNRSSYILFLIMIFSISIFISGCGGGASEEPNNKISKAVKLELSKPFNMKITPKKDVDWYKVNIPGQGYIKVSASNVPEKIKPEASFANYKEWEGNKEVYLRDNIKLPAAAFVEKKGDYYIKINDEYNDNESSDSFSIKLDFIKEMDKSEPNNNPKNVKLIKAGEVINLAIYPAKDKDWYKIKVNGQGYLSVKAKNIPEDIKVEVKFAEYDEWADPKINDLRDWVKVPASCFIPKKGEYYVSFKDEYDDDMSVKTFDIKVEYMKEMDVYEPNDQYENAKLIERNDIVEPAMFPQKDQDYFKFVLKNNNKVKFVTKDVAEEMVHEVRIYKKVKENDEKLKSVTDWRKCPAEFELELNQGYYLLLHDEYDNNESKKTFKLKME